MTVAKNPEIAGNTTEDCGAPDGATGILCIFSPNHPDGHSWEIAETVRLQHAGTALEQVSHPAHYNDLPARCKHGHPIECIDVVQHMTFNQGNAVKYLWRLFGKGDPVVNLQKAITYCQYEIERLSRS